MLIYMMRINALRLFALRGGSSGFPYYMHLCWMDSAFFYAHWRLIWASLSATHSGVLVWAVFLQSLVRHFLQLADTHGRIFKRRMVLVPCYFLEFARRCSEHRIWLVTVLFLSCLFELDLAGPGPGYGDDWKNRIGFVGSVLSVSRGTGIHTIIIR